MVSGPHRTNSGINFRVVADSSLRVDHHPRPRARPGQRRILVVADRLPGIDNGNGIRIANIIDGLVRVGAVHVCLIDSTVDGVRPPADRRVTANVVRADEWRRWRKVAGAFGEWPPSIRYRRERALHDELTTIHGQSWMPWDLVWCSRARVHVLTRSVIPGPRIVDLDDLNDRLLLSEMGDRRLQSGRLVTAPRNLVDAVQARRWRRLQRDIAAEVDRVVVCSAYDQRYLDVPNAAVVPNGYPVPAVEPPPAGGEKAPSMLFVGPLTYEPNRLAVQWIAERVLPLVRREVPDFAFDVIGNDPRMAIGGTDAPGVRRHGYVEDVGPYYARATVAVTPLHSGGGTRLKAIEALARRVPLVSTSFAFEGLGLVADRDLLVADDPAAFAAACIAVATQPGLRSRLTDAGYRRFHHHLTAQASSDAVQRLASDVIVAATAAGAPARRRQA